MTVCIVVNGEKNQNHAGLDLGPVVPNVEFIRYLLMYHGIVGYINQLLIGWKRYPTVYTD